MPNKNTVNMREDSLELVRKHLPDTSEGFAQLTKTQQALIIQVRDCYAMQISNPWISRKEVRMTLVDRYKITVSQAYNVIALTSQLLGDVPTAHKNWIRIKAEALLEEANDAAESRDFALAAEKRKLAKTLGFLFRLDQDEGELLDAQKYLNIERVNITFDPNDIGVKYTSKDKELADKFVKQFVEEADYEEVKDEESVSS